ncbi:metal ABC transporter permease [Fischerella sp.]|jgi:hypothetical protein|uniref:metal ABC transporter permease n=1 Tax=Fischerella sp. TaxID=1191 RepID=UPI0025B85BE8|nr:metal ABC transporter permease [Fischerella sp.]
MGDRFDHMMLIAIASGVFSSVMGTYICYHIDGSTGGCIVVLQTLLFVMVMIFAQRDDSNAQHLRLKQGEVCNRFDSVPTGQEIPGDR